MSEGTRAPSRTILLLGTHGQFNLGDELLLETFLSQFGTEHRYYVNSYAPSKTAAQLDQRFTVEVFDTAKGRLDLLRHLRASDLVVFGGGSILKELYPSTGRWRYATLFMVLTIAVFCRLVVRRPILMSNIGVGPITTATGRRLTRWILHLVSLVAVRDRGSLETCLAVGADPAKLRLVPDAVWVNEPEVFLPEPLRQKEATTRPVRIALNLNRDIENGAHWEPFLDLLEEALRLVAATTPIELHALPMQSRFKEHHDLRVLEEFLARLPDVASIFHDTEHHVDIGRIIADCDVVVSERLHAIVIAAILGRATVALMYDVKVQELVEQLELVDRAVDINTTFDPASLADMIVAAVDDAEGEGRRLAARADELRADVSRYFDDVRAWVAEPSGAGWSMAPPTLSEV
ncbi:MAG: polysaccharide pyruvyl transferase family protein [Acidimicrobiia bacterium]|nr:polysaccharide pyruvyl transferase family protein [Acidimicrobiia bacterium]